MSGHPRRTTELMSSTNKPSERKSRIAMPIRRTTQVGVPGSTVKRSQSIDRYSYRANSILPPGSTAKKNRSSSQTPSSRSAFQTPTTPGNRTPISSSYLQSADKRGPVEDKLFIHHEAAKITNFGIRYNVQGFGKDTKLKNLTYKQFTGLVEFMLEKLVGNRCPVDGIDNIMKVLHTLDYPYTMNKSWLKTPTAGHAFSHVVLMLGWLLNLVEPPLMPGGETEIDDFECIHNLVHETDFPTIMFQKVFMEKAKEGFKMWDLQEDNDFEKLNEELANMHVSQSTNGAITNIKRLDDDLVALQKEEKQLKSQVKPSANQQLYLELENEVKQMRRILDGKREIVDQLKESIAVETKNHEDEQKILKQRNTQINQLKSRIRSQIMSKDKLKQILEENFALRQTLEAEMSSFDKLSEENVKDPVEVSQLVRQKVQKINELNENMFLFAKNFEKAIPNFNPVEYELNANSPELQSQLQKLKPTLEMMRNWLVEASQIYKTSHITTKTQIEEISCEFEQNQLKLKQAAERVSLELQTLNAALADAEKKYTEIDGKYNKEKEEQEKVKKEIAEVKVEIDTEKTATAKIQEETQIIIKRFMEQQEEALEGLRQQSKQLDEKLEHYRKVRDEVQMEAARKQKEILDKLLSLGY